VTRADREIARLRAEVERLEAENARLRQGHRTIIRGEWYEPAANVRAAEAETRRVMDALVRMTWERDDLRHKLDAYELLQTARTWRSLEVP
jgi:hypothetical protein